MWILPPPDILHVMDVIGGHSLGRAAILVVGNLAAWRREKRSLPRLREVRFVEVADLSAALLREVRPDVVLSLLLDDGIDALEIARRLSDLGFRGRYRALASGLPCPAMVREEIREAVPDLDFDLIEITPGPRV